MERRRARAGPGAPRSVATRKPASAWSDSGKSEGPRGAAVAAVAAAPSRQCDGDAARQPHRGCHVRDRTVAGPEAPARGSGGPLQTDKVHAPGDPRHVPRLQAGV